MKLKNAVVGTKVQVKGRSIEGQTPFYSRSWGCIGTITRVDDDGDVHVVFECDNRDDFGHHSQVRRIKE